MELASKEEASRLGHHRSCPPRTPPPAPGPGAAPPHATRQWTHQSAQTPPPVASRAEAATSAAWERSGSHSQPAAVSDPAKRRTRPSTHSPWAGRRPTGRTRPPGFRGRPRDTPPLRTQRRQRASTGHPDPKTAQTRPATRPTPQTGGRAEPDALTSAWTRSHGRSSPPPRRPGASKPLPQARSQERTEISS